MQLLHRVVYGLFAAILIGVGGVGFLLPFGILPSISATHSVESLHVIQEAGSGALALGLLAAWCMFEYERSTVPHWILTVFFVLISALHWIDFGRGQRPVTSGLINSIPAVTLIALALLRARHGPRPHGLADRG